MYTYPIDFELFNSEEVVKLVEFLSLIEDVNEKKKINPDKIKLKYREFQKICNSLTIQKKIDRDFEKVSGYSIYSTMSKIK